MRYPTTVNLPFNHEVIRYSFVPLLPGREQPVGEGIWLLLQGNSLLVATDAGGKLALPAGKLPAEVSLSAEPLCIGLYNGVPLRLAAVSRSVALPPEFLAEPFNAAGDRLDDATLSLGGIGMQILHWQKKSRHCSSCGSKLEPLKWNWGKLCRVCNYEHFPAIHPCAIVLVRRGDEFLLARKSEWQPGRYGLVAGFLDMGESLEECAAREVLEETGIVIKNTTYVGSQCWPFPSQLMAGFVADYASGEIKVDESELEDARWFRRGALPDGLPPARSIARWIIDRYMLAAD
ncbi:MAG: NAD(+) diphosphatase [Geobacter sp.]|nr:NAD(+) diphosphatase [Geobacter sp.]